MGLLQETCDAIHSRSKEIEQHIIKNWNDASDSKQYDVSSIWWLNMGQLQIKRM